MTNRRLMTRMWGMLNAEAKAETQPTSGEWMAGEMRSLTTLPTATPEDVAPEDTAIVDSTIWPGERGQVRFQATWWKARCAQPVPLFAGSRVQVIGREGLTLWVVPLPPQAR